MKRHYALNFVDKLLDNYRINSRSYQKVRDFLYKNGEWTDDIQTDHIAIRSFRRNNGFEKLYNIFTQDKAWSPMEKYNFPSKNIEAQWFRPNHIGYPRIFLSEILDHQLSPLSQKIINKYISKDDEKRIVSYSDYLEIDRESNYAAWTLIHGNSVNHETIPVHKLKFSNTLEKFINNEKELPKLLRTPEIIKKSEDGLLLQASSHSDIVNVIFREGIYKVPGSFFRIHRKKSIKRI